MGNFVVFLFFYFLKFGLETLEGENGLEGNYFKGGDWRKKRRRDKDNILEERY